MAVSIIDALAELARQSRTRDANYYKKMPWVFKLVVEGESYKGPTGPEGVAIFQLPMNPTRFDYTLPFAQSLTPQQETGVVAEEGGIVIADIAMSATTGFKLKKDQNWTFAPSNAVFTSQITNQGATFQEEISGQFLFWILANRCFEGYSELKKDPQLASKTRLELHIMKEQLHLEVVPASFKLTRDAGKTRVTYSYEINLKVIGEAKPIDYDLASEKSLFDEMKDSISKIRQAVQSISASIQDINAAIGELTRFAGSIGSLMDDLATIVDSSNNLVTGAKGFLDIPKNFITSTSNLVESTAELFENISTIPADVAQTFLNIGDELNKLQVAARNHYSQGWENTANAYNRLTETNQNSEQEISDYQQDLIDQAQQNADDSQGTMSIDDAFGSAFKPGDKDRQAFAKAGDRLNKREYSGFEERVIGQGDTLQSLAARYLLDPTKWVDIAVVNKLRPPYITNGAKINGTLQRGSKVLIPISKNSTPARVFTTGNADVGESQSEVHLGTDIELVKLSNGQYGWAVDTSHGATDARLISGIDNMSQAILVRLKTIQGENIIFPRLGLPRLVGVKQLQDNTSEAALRVRQQLLADPRIERIIKYEFELVDDALTLFATVMPVGFNTSRVISRTLT